MELYQLEQFKAAAELSHITKAAQMLSISQPALSKNIRALERELGYPLFDHIGKHIRLNKNGEIFLKHVREVFQCLDNAQRELKACNTDLSSSVSLCVRAASKLLPEILQTYSMAHPGVRFSISQSDSALKTPADHDFTIESSLSPSSGIDCCTLLQENILIALPAGHRLCTESSIDLSDLKEEPFISLQKGMGLSAITDYYCQLCGFVPNIVFESDSPSTLRSLIHLGLGVAFIPELTWSGLEDTSIRLLPVRSLKCRRYIILKWDSRRYLSPVVLEFKEFLIRYFSGLQEEKQDPRQSPAAS